MIKEICNATETQTSSFMDGVQLSQGYSTTMRRQFIFYH